jgi:hypothetical protein
MSAHAQKAKRNQIAAVADELAIAGVHEWCVGDTTGRTSGHVLIEFEHDGQRHTITLTTPGLRAVARPTFFFQPNFPVAFFKFRIGSFFSNFFLWFLGKRAECSAHDGLQSGPGRPRTPRRSDLLSLAVCLARAREGSDIG